MKPSLLLLFTSLVAAGGGSSEAQTTAAPAGCTDWVSWVTDYDTVYSTTTSYVTKYSTSTTTTTDYDTKYSTYTTTLPPVTYISTITLPPVTYTSIITLPPVTYTSTVTSTVPVTIPVTVPGPTNTVTVPGSAATTTVTVTVPVSVPVTVPVTVPGSAATVTIPGTTVTVTVSQTATVPATQTVATTVNQQITATITTISRITVSASSTCPVGTGITTCESRIINPTYTPPTPLPSTHLWGCPPGYLCYPKRENCNFEQNPPAKSYFCSPDQCRPVVQLPPRDAYYAANKFQNGSCAWYTPIDDYFNLNPLFLGLNFGIFNIYGQATCTSTSACPTATPQPASTAWAAWSEPSASVASKVSSAPPKVTKRARLSERALKPRQLGAASECYASCNYANLVFQNSGQVPAMCSPFSDAYAAAAECVDNQTGTIASIYTVFDIPLDYCATAAPARRFARG